MKTGRPRGITKGLGPIHTIRFHVQQDALLKKTATRLGIDFTELVRACCKAFDLKKVADSYDATKRPFLVEMLQQHPHNGR